MAVSAIEQINCPNCRSDRSKPWATENGWQAVQCNECRLVYVNPRPMASYISEAQQVGYHESEEGKLNVKGRRAEYKIPYYTNVIRELFAEEIAAGKPLKWLDVGAGYGEVVQAAQSVLPQASAVEGLEPMPAKVAVARQHGINLHSTDLANVGQDYDVVSLINVYSHIPDFDSFGAELIAKLKPGGVLLLETGNLADLGRREDFPNILVLPDHLVFGGIQQLKQTLERLGLVPGEPMLIRTDTPLWCLKTFVKGLLRKKLVIRLPGRSDYRSMIFKARKPA